MTLFSCFICAKQVSDYKNTCPRKGRPKKMIENNLALKDLLQFLCKLLSVSDVTVEDWNFLSDLKRQQNICCEKCYELIKDVERVHQFFLTTQKLLRKYLDHVETLIVRSEEQTVNVDNSLWSSSCHQLRRTVLNRKNRSKEDYAGVKVKEESYEEYDDADWETLDANFEHHHNDKLPNDKLDSSETTRGGEQWAQHSAEKDNFWGTATTLPMEFAIPDEEEEIISDILKCESEKTCADDNQSAYAPRKETVSSHLDNELPNDKCERSSRKRTAKQNAEHALKQYASFSTTDDKDPLEENDQIWEEQDDNVSDDSPPISPISPSDASEDDDDGNDEWENEKSKRKTQTSRDSTNKNISRDKQVPLPKKELSKNNKSRRKRPSKPRERRFVCDFEGCGKAFDIPKNLRRHQQSHLPYELRTDTAKCPECGKLVMKDGLNKHLRKIHFPEQASRVLVCEYCNKRYLSEDRSKFEVHLRIHRGENPFVCNICEAAFPSKTYLRNHMFNHPTTNSTPLPCEWCDKVYYHPNSLRTHKVRYHKDKYTVGPRKKEMSKFYTSQAERKKPCERPYICDFEGCGKAFETPKGLRRHKQTHLPMEERTDKTMCTECGKEVLNLIHHMRSSHSTPDSLENVLVCPICDKRFLPGRNATLAAHIRHHRGERPFLCTECGKSFVDTGGLHGHMKQVHGPEQEIPCEFCEAVYNKKYSWMRHMELKHPEKYVKKPSKRKMSKFYYNEEEEEKKKNRIGPIQKYPCPICETICSFRFTLKKHMMRIHGTDGKDITQNVNSQYHNVNAITDIKPTHLFSL